MNSPPAADASSPQDDFDDGFVAEDTSDSDEPDCYETIMAALHDEDAEQISQSLTNQTIDQPSNASDENLDQTFQRTEQEGTGKSTNPGSVRKSDRRSAIPDRVGKFAIKRELGRGAFGVVYLGYDEELQRNVAIKVSLVSDPERQQKLKTEASKAAQIESNGIVPVYHIGTTDEGLVFIVHKFIPGCALRDLLKQGPISPAHATSLMRDLAFAMAPAHQLDILHRDLKPDNVLIDKNGEAWIADFGLAISESEQTSQRRELAGTPPYMSPEQIKGRVDFLDARSDLWAFGVMYYELLSGKLPFRGKCRASLTEQICERDPRPLQQYAPQILTKEINQVFAKACAKQPSDRYATMIEFATALEDLLETGLSENNILGESNATLFGSEGSEMLPMRSRLGTQASRGPSSRNLSRSKDSNFPSSELLGNGSRWGMAPTLMLLAVSLICLGIAYVMLVAKSSDGLVAVNDPTPSTAELDSAILIDAAEELASAVTLDSNMAEQNRGDMPLLAVDKRLDGELDVISIADPEPKPLPEGTQEDPMIVASDGTGSHRTLAAAIEDLRPDGFIQLRSGSYSVALSIDKPLTVIGPTRAPGEEINCILQNDADTVVRIDCEQGRILFRDVRIVGKGTKMTNEFNAVEVASGTLIMEDCEFTTSSFNCVKVREGGVFGARGCQFFDSRKISVSAKNHGHVALVDCRFQGAGVELIGGAGVVSDCQFFGDRGVWCKQNVSPVKIMNCKFDNGRSNAVAALEGGQINLQKCQFLQGDKAIQVIGGKVVVEPGCLINDFMVAVFITSGSLEMNATEILESGGSAFQIAGTASVRLKDCKIEDASAFGIDMVSGSLDLIGGSMTGCNMGCINLDASSPKVTQPKGHDQQDALKYKLSLTDCTLSCPNVGIAIRRGELTLNDVSFESGGKNGGIGVYVDGSKIGDESSPVTVRMNQAVSFSDSLKMSVFARGNAFLDVPAKLQASMQKTAKLLPPAEYMDPLPIIGTESE